MADAAGVAPLALSATQQVQGATARRPRALLKAAGQSLPLKSFRCDENSFYQANTFHAELAFSAMPAGYGLAWWSDQDQIDVEIFAGFPPDPSHFTTNDLESLFYGRVDAVEDIALDAGTFAISGRDLTGRMIDTKTSEKYPNLTASQIAGLLAAKYGLTPVITPTATKVGRYYEVDSVRSQSDRTEWDLLTWLAREEGFNVFVRRRELHFGPAGGEGTPYVLTYRAPTAEQTAAANATAIKLSRNLTLTKPIKVVVRSWHAKDKATFQRTATSAPTGQTGKGKGAEAPQVYTRNIPGLDPAKAQDRANQILAELMKHERKLSFEGPADVGLTAGGTIQLVGTGSAFDQSYFPESIVREGGEDEGYRWSVSAKNRSPELGGEA